MDPLTIYKKLVEYAKRLKAQGKEGTEDFRRVEAMIREKAQGLSSTDLAAPPAPNPQHATTVPKVTGWQQPVSAYAGAGFLHHPAGSLHQAQPMSVPLFNPRALQMLQGQIKAYKGLSKNLENLSSQVKLLQADRARQVERIHDLRSAVLYVLKRGTGPRCSVSGNPCFLCEVLAPLSCAPTFDEVT